MVFDYVANAHTTKIQNYCTAKLVNGKMQQLILGRAKPAPRIKPLHILECGDVENFLCDPHEHPLKTAGVTRLCADDVSKALGLDDAKGTSGKCDTTVQFGNVSSYYVPVQKTNAVTPPTDGNGWTQEASCQVALGRDGRAGADMLTLVQWLLLMSCQFSQVEQSSVRCYAVCMVTVFRKMSQ